MKILLIILIIILIYLYLIKPNNSRKDALIPYHQKYIAHRGFYNNTDVPENSLLAFKKAVENDYGIELDIQITLDDKLVVFHDTSLKRMCGIDKDLIDCTYDELLQYPLLDTDHKIPLFSEVLKCLKKDTPLVVEIKPDGRYIETTKKTVELMRQYDGLYNMESFNPLVVRYLKDNEPDIIRGQLSYNYIDDENSKLNIILKFVATHLLYNFYCKPDYVAYDINNMNNLSFRIISKLYKSECVAWTVKSKKELDQAHRYYQTFIFDSFIPDQDS